MKLPDYIRIAKRWLPLALVLAAGMGAAAYAITKEVIKPQYTARFTMEVQVGLPSSTVSPDPAFAQMLAQTEAAVAQQGPIVKHAVAIAARSVPVPPTAAEATAVSHSVQCQTEALTSLFSCSATSHDPRLAAAATSAIASVFMQREQAWEQSRYALALTHIAAEKQAAKQAGDIARYNDLAQQETTILVAQAQGSTIMRVVSPATVPTAPSSPHPTLNAALAFLLTLMLVGVVGITSDRLTDSIRDVNELEQLIDLPTLGTIPTAKALKDKQLSPDSLLVVNNPRSPFAEAVRVARTGISFSRLDTPPRTLLVTSSVEGEGKSIVASNLAAAFAETGKSVILVDLDLRRPSLGAIFGSRSSGVTRLLLNNVSNPESQAPHVGSLDLRVLPSGPVPPSPSEIVGSQRMASLLERLRQHADLVVIDSPPVLVAADAAVIAGLCDTAVLVVRLDRVQRRTLVRACDTLSGVGVKIAGMVVNAVDRTEAAYYQAYRYYGETPPPTSGQAPRPQSVVIPDQEVAEG